MTRLRQTPPLRPLFAGRLREARQAQRSLLDRGRTESGQSLVLIVVAMFVILAVAALAIDGSSWYQKHHQEQVAADSAALAAANCLANESAANTAANMCTSATDTVHATSVATAMASTNTASSWTVSYGTSTSGTITNVTVTTSVATPVMFAGLAGLKPTATATAVATITPGTQPCSSSGSHCLMFYAADDRCSSAAIAIQVGSSVNMNGGILTNSYITDQGNGGNFTGQITYGAGAACANKETLKGTSNSVYAPQQATSDFGSSITPNWPIDYASRFPPCSGTGSGWSNCSPSGWPNYCDYESTSTSTTLTTSSDGVYCAIGSGTKSDPSTWNGSVAAGRNSGAKITMIGGSVSISGVDDTADSNGLLAYATGTSPQAFDGTGGNTTWSGDVFAPQGGATISGGNVTFTGFIQAQNVTYKGGNSTGDGPIYNGGTILAGTDTLTG
jgi:Flp pilus assembly protein TadG